MQTAVHRLPTSPPVSAVLARFPGVRHLYRCADVAGDDENIGALLDRLTRLSVVGLRRMYNPVTKLFAFTRRRTAAGDAPPEGESFRYSAISLLGVAQAAKPVQRHIFCGQTAREYATVLLKRLPRTTNLGDAALATWAAAALHHSGLQPALAHLRRRVHEARRPLTVEVAWTLSALTAAAELTDVTADIDLVHHLLLEAHCGDSGLFRHFVVPNHGPWYRAHVASFADQVYPVQALARHGRKLNNGTSLAIAAGTAAKLCHNQGPEGQWWWHYDVRSGDVIEGYPVYTVHQDAMAPMALLDLKEAGGPDLSTYVRRGLHWLLRPAEIGPELIDDELALIWRSVRRAGPVRAARAIRALLSRFAPDCRFAAINRLLKPLRIDYEDRPYHFGWIMFSWLGCL